MYTNYMVYANNSDTMYGLPKIQVLWTQKMEYNEAIKSHPAAKWNGLYFITRERAGEEKPAYIGLNASENNTIFKRLQDHKSNRLPQRGFKLYVRIGHINGKFTREKYEVLLHIVEGALIDSVDRQYKLINKQKHCRYANKYPPFIIQNIDARTKRPIKFLSRPIHSWDQIRLR